MEPKYSAFWRWLYTPIIIWQGDWIHRDCFLLISNLFILYHVSYPCIQAPRKKMKIKNEKALWKEYLLHSKRKNKSRMICFLNLLDVSMMHFLLTLPPRFVQVAQVFGSCWHPLARKLRHGKTWKLPETRLESWVYCDMFNRCLGGGFKHFLFSPLFGEDSHVD